MTPRVTVRDVVRRCDNCGWKSKPGTVGRTDYAYRKHSCDRTRLLEARAARVDARKSADGPKRRCRHKYANHQHGTPAAFSLDRCKCRPCRDAHNAAAQHRSREQAYGRWQPFVDAEPVREHVRQLRQSGMGLKVLARVSHVSHGALSKLMYGKRMPDGSYRLSKQVRQETARKILAVEATYDTLGATTPVESTGTRRRLRALVANGHSMSSIGRRLGPQWTSGNIHSLIGSDRGVAAKTAAAVRDLYAVMANEPPDESTPHARIAASRARNYAKARDWLGPAWWDEDTIDVPDNVVELDGPDHDEVAVDRFMAWALVQQTGKTSKREGRPPLDDADQLEAIRRLLALERTPTAIGVLLGRNNTYTAELIRRATAETEEQIAS